MMTKKKRKRIAQNIYYSEHLDNYLLYVRKMKSHKVKAAYSKVCHSLEEAEKLKIEVEAYYDKHGQYPSTRNAKARKEMKKRVGKTFGDLTVLSIGEPEQKAGTKTKKRYALCRCSCGNLIKVAYMSVIEGNTKSCGHLKREHDKKELNSPNVIQKRNRTIRESDKPFKTNKLGIKNVYYDYIDDRYNIDVIRYGKRYRGHAKTLEQALLVKQNLLKQSEEEKHSC